MPLFAAHISPHLGDLSRIGLVVAVRKHILLFMDDLVGPRAAAIEGEIAAVEISRRKIANEVD